MHAVATGIDSGQRVGRYQPIRRLAVGGMAEIFLARVPGVGIEGFEKLVVLKRILPQHALDPELLRMFLDEARLSATLTHPHVIEVYDVGADGDAPFFAMEYVHGENVREMLRAQARAAAGKPSAPLPLAHAITIVAAAAEGLHYAHERLGPGGKPLGIVHRDVSPSNVLVSYDGAVKVSDFGIAKWAFQRTRTQEGTLKGKFAYMSPEQCRARPVDRRSDIFALGAILYELTTGRRAVRGRERARHPEPDRDRSRRAARVARGDGHVPAGAVGDRAARAGARARRALPDDAGAADRAGVVRARRRASRCRRWRWRRIVQELFADELAAWRAAQKEGKSLADHLAAKPVVVASADPAERTATDAFGTTAARARKSVRALRTGALAGFFALCAVAGALATKHWRDDGAAPNAGAARVEKDPRSAAPGAERNPATVPTAEKTLPSTTVIPAVATNPLPTTTTATTTDDGDTNAKTKAKVKPAVIRQARNAAAGPTSGPRPTADSRLGAWDPDSPVPP